MIGTHFAAVATMSVEDAACPRRCPCPRWPRRGWSGRGCRPRSVGAPGRATHLLDARTAGRPACRSATFTAFAASAGKPSWRIHRSQQRQAVVELVVAQRHGVVVDDVHRPGHRVLLAGGGDRLLLGVVGGQRGALDGVAGVEDQRGLAAPLGADLVDQGGQLRDADVVVRAVVVLGVAVVVPVVDVAVGVRGAEDGEVPGLRGRARAGRLGRARRRSAGRSPRRPRRRAPGGATGRRGRS